MIKWTYAYFVDNDREIIELREGHTDYTHYIEFLLACINTSKKLSKYNITSNDTEVVSCVIKSVKAQFEANDEEKAIILRNCETIANRFLRKEIEVKKDVKQLPVEVRSGCLIIAYIITDKVNQYLISKMDWSDFLQRVDLNKTQGIEINKKRLGKSCLFTLDIDEAKDISIIDAQILLDNKASYFCDAFLELTPFYRDDYNTETMVNVALKLIDDSFRKKYPQERMLLRNSFIHYVKANEFIDYTEISNDIFQKYIQSDACRIEQADKDMFLNKLNELPEKKKFSRQFTRIPKSIKARVIKNDYKLTTFARLEIQDADQNEILAKIKSGSDDDGSTYLKIYTEDQEAIETFKPEQIVRLGE